MHKEVKEIKRKLQKQGWTFRQAKGPYELAIPPGDHMSGHPDGWTITIDVAGSATDDQLDDLAEALADQGAAVAGNDRGYGATFSLDGLRNAVEAVQDGADLFRKAAANVGLRPDDVLRLAAVTYAQHDRELEERPIPELVGTGEIAKILGVTRQRVSQLQHRDDFPEPIAKLAAGPVWARPQLERFIEEWPRKGGRPPGKLLFVVAEDERDRFQVGSGWTGSDGRRYAITRINPLADPRDAEPGYAVWGVVEE